MSVTTIFTLALLAQTPVADGLSLAELPAYATALSKTIPRPTRVKFQSLWAERESYRGRAVEVSGEVARVFRAPAQGELPPRVEVWIAQGQNLICVVLPDHDEAVRVGQSLIVSGTSLGLVRYRGGDVERLAPLIVGPGPARPTSEKVAAHELAVWSPSAWGLAVLASVSVVVFLLRSHARRPMGTRTNPNDGVEFLS